MARITVENSLKNIPNQFELVMLATRRAQQLDFDAGKASAGFLDSPSLCDMALFLTASSNSDPASRFQ